MTSSATSKSSDAASAFLAMATRHRSPWAPQGAYACPDLEKASREQIRETQGAKLALAYEYLLASSPYYAQKFAEAGLGPGSIRGIEDLHKIPVTRKTDWISDIAASPPWGTFSPLQPERWAGGGGWQVFSTSGTTRSPRLFRFTEHDQRMLGWICARALWSYGVRPGQLALNCFSYGPSVAAWGMHQGLGIVGCPVIAAGAMPTDRRVLFTKLASPTVLLGTPSTLLTLAHRMKELGDDPCAAGVKTLACAGEPGAAVQATRLRLSAEWGGASVHDNFGCTEVAPAPLGYTCGHEAARTEGEVGVHLMEDMYIVEVLDPETLQPVAPGELGTLVVSNLFSESGPFLRFDMGDWIRVTDEPCACGRTHMRALGGLLGRNDHCLKIKGLQFFPSTFEDALRSITGLGDEYRVEVRAEYREGHSIARPAATSDRRRHRDTVTVVVERLAGAELVEADIATRLRGILGIGVEVKLMDPGSLPRSEGKGVRFVDLRETSQ